MLGFSSDRTAQRLIKIANTTLTSDLTPPEALKISREAWGHAANHLAQGTGENEWYTPALKLFVVEHDRLADALGMVPPDRADSSRLPENIVAARRQSEQDTCRDWQPGGERVVGADPRHFGPIIEVAEPRYLA